MWPKQWASRSKVTNHSENLARDTLDYAVGIRETECTISAHSLHLLSLSVNLALLFKVRRHQTLELGGGIALRVLLLSSRIDFFKSPTAVLGEVGGLVFPCVSICGHTMWCALNSILYRMNSLAILAQGILASKVSSSETSSRQARAEEATTYIHIAVADLGIYNIASNQIDLLTSLCRWWVASVVTLQS